MKVLFISGDSDGRVHAREWRIRQRKNIDFDEEFINCLSHYRQNGHYVPESPFDESNFDERRIMTIEFNGYLNFVKGEQYE